MRFLLTNIKYGLLRHMKQTLSSFLALLVLSVSAMVFFSSIIGNENRLTELSETADIRLRITNIAGTDKYNLFIYAEKLDAIEETGLAEPIMLSSKALFTNDSKGEGKISRREAGQMWGISGISDGAWLSEANVSYIDGYDGSFLSGSDQLCIVSDSYLKEKGLEPGDELEIYIYSVRERSMGMYEIWAAGKQSYKIIGSYEDVVSGEISSGTSVIMPYATLRKNIEAGGRNFSGSSAEYKVNDPSRISELKAAMREAKFGEVQKKTDSYSKYGDTALINDTSFRAAAEPIMKNLSMLRSLLIPVMAVVLLISMICSYLSIKGRREEAAVETALGAGKGRVFAHLFAEWMIVSVLATAGSLFVSSWIMSVGAAQLLLPCAVLLLADAVGAAATIFLLLRGSFVRIITRSE